MHFELRRFVSFRFVLLLFLFVLFACHSFSVFKLCENVANVKVSALSLQLAISMRIRREKKRKENVNAPCNVLNGVCISFVSCCSFHCHSHTLQSTSIFLFIFLFFRRLLLHFNVTVLYFFFPYVLRSFLLEILFFPCRFSVFRNCLYNAIHLIIIKSNEVFFAL